MKRYEVTITEVTILYVEAETEPEAEHLAWDKWETGAYGSATSATQVKEVQNDKSVD